VFIADSLPDSMQLIVCVTKHLDVPLDKTTVFNTKYSTLLPECYDEVESDVEPLYRPMNAALLSIPIGEAKEDKPEADSPE
jgi:hypothetical protein